MTKAGRARNDITYSTSFSSRFLRGLVLLVENLTGRVRLIRMAEGYEKEVEAGEDFWAVMQRRYGVSLDFVGGGPERIPAEGPAVIVANHPYGILDSLALGRLLSMRRKDFRIVAHSIFDKVPDLKAHLIPIDFSPGREATQRNIESRKLALEHLAGGGMIAIYPGGTVSTAASPFGRPIDPQWKNFTAKLVTRSGAPVIPVFFDGANSRMFQVASHISYVARTALLIREFGARVDGAVRMVVGQPVDPEEISARKRDPVALMDYLRAATYALAPNPFETLQYGCNFE